MVYAPGRCAWGRHHCLNHLLGSENRNRQDLDGHRRGSIDPGRCRRPLWPTLRAAGRGYSPTSRRNCSRCCGGVFYGPIKNTTPISAYVFALLLAAIHAVAVSGRHNFESWVRHWRRQYISDNLSQACPIE